MNKLPINSRSGESQFSESAPSGFSPFLKSSRNQLRVLAASCVVTGGVAVILLPGVAQSPAIVPAVSKAPASSKPSAELPLMTRASLLNTALIPALPDLGEVPQADAVPAPAPRSISQTQRAISTISIEVKNGKVVDLLTMIAMQADIGIMIGSDVDDDITIPYIRLNNVTPEQAIAQIAKGGNLLWTKQKDQTFFVGKAPVAPEKASPSITPRRVAIQDNTWGDDDQQINDQASYAPRQKPASLFPELIQPPQTLQREPREIRPLRIRNVRPGIIAWWIDPRHQEEPYEYKRARSNMIIDGDHNFMRPAVDATLYAQMNNPTAVAPAMNFAQPYVPGAYVNTYANPVAYTTALPAKYRVNNQLFPGQPGGNGVLQPGQTLGPNGQILQNGQVVNNTGLNTQGGTLDLPEGIDQLVAVDAQNIILVYGTADAVAKLQTIIDYLDRPVRQVEIEAQFIDVSVNELRGFGIQFFSGGVPNAGTGTGTGTGGGSLGTGIPGANQLTISYGQYAAQLNLLAQSGNSRIISSPRVTTMNNLSATLQSSQTTPIVLTSSTTGIGGQVAQAQQAFSLTTSVGIQVTPTILNDDTITVFVTPQVQTQAPTPGLGGGANTPAIPTVLSQSLTTVANVKDSDVIVLGGLRTRSETIANTRIPILSRIPVIGKLFQSRNKTDVDRELVIFLTARIYRRTDDVAPFQGP